MASWSDKPRRRLWPRLGRTMLLGLFLIPVVCGLTFGLLVVSTQAMLGASQPGVGQAVDALLIAGGWLEPSPTIQPTAVAFIVSNTPFEPNTSLDSLAPSRTPFPSRTPTHTATITNTPTETETPSPTPTETLTPTATGTPTSSSTPTNTATRTPYPTWTPSNTPRPSSTFTPTHTVTPSETPVPPTVDPDAPTTTPSNTADPAATPSATLEPTDPPPTNTPAGCSTSLNTGYEATVEDLINGARADVGLSPLSRQSQLLAAARNHAADMACNHFTGHTGSDGSSVRDRVEAQGYSWSWIGENYMVTGSGPQAAFNWWMNSTPHRNNILGSSYTEFGVGFITAEGADHGGYYVVVFARPG